MESFSLNHSIKIGAVNSTSIPTFSRKKALHIHDFHHYKITCIKLFSQSYLSGIEIQYQLQSENPESSFENFFVDSFQSLSLAKSSSSSPSIKTLSHNFHSDEEIIEISGRSGTCIDQLMIKTSHGKILRAGGDGGGEFSYKAPIGYCFNLIRSCGFKEYIENIEMKIELSSVFRFKLYKTIEENANDAIFNDYSQMEQKIEVDDDLLRSRFDFERNSNEMYTYKTMRNELKEIIKIDKLGFIRYYLKGIYLDKIKILESKSFSEELVKTLREIYKLLKYPRILFNEKDKKNNSINLEELLLKKTNPIHKTHPIYQNIFKLLIIVKCLLESPAPFAPSFICLKNLLLNIHDLYISFLITLTNLQKEKNIDYEKSIEKIKSLLKPPIYLYGHHIGFYILSENLQKLILENSKNMFKINQLVFRRINCQDIFSYERQILVHCFNRKLFNLPSLPSTIMGLRQFKTNKFDKPNESFFILSLEPNNSSETKPLDSLTYDEIASLNDISFTNHLIASMFSAPLESVSASFVFNTKNKELIRIPHWHDPSHDLKPITQENASLRNPLYYIETPALLKPINQEILEKIRNLPLEQLLVEFLAWIRLETCLISFEYFKNTNNNSNNNINNMEVVESKNREKDPIYSLSEEILTYLFKRTVNNMAFIKDNCHLQTIDILFHLNPMVSLCQEQLLKHFPELDTRLKQISRFDFEVIFARSKIEMKKLCRAKIRKYTEKVKKTHNIRGNASIHQTVTNWLKNFPLNKMEKSKIESFLQEMLVCFPLTNNQEIYSHWNQYMNWEDFIPYIFKNPVIMEFLLDLQVDIKKFQLSGGLHFTNLFDMLTDENEKEINDLLILEVYMKKAGFNPDEGYPFIITPFERAVRKESHVLIQKMLALGAGIKANLEILQGYVIKFYDHDEYELLVQENIKTSIKFNIELLLELHPLIKGKLVWELLKKKPPQEKIEEYKSYFSWDNEEFFVYKKAIEKTNQDPNSFILYFSHKNLFFDIMFDNETRFHGLHFAITSLMNRSFGSEACVIPTRFVKDSDKNCFEVKEFFPVDRRVFDSSKNSYNQLNNLNFEDICERIIMNIILLPNEVKPEDERIYRRNDGKIRVVPWDFSHQFMNYYLEDEPKHQKDFIKTISYLLCLDEMKLPLSGDLRVRIINLDLYKELDECLHELSNLHWKLSTFRQGICKKEEDYLGVLLKQNMIFYIAFRFLKLQSLLSRDKITLNEIFKEIDPDIYEIYQGLNGNTYLERYKDLLLVANKDLEDFKYTDYGVYLQIKSQISRNIMSIFKQEEFIGPEEAILEMRAIKEGFVKEKIAQNTLEFKGIQDFEHILYALRSFDFKDTKKELQADWIEKGLIGGFEKQLHSFSEKVMSLKLKNMSFLTVQILEKMPLLKQIRCLILQGCALSDEIILLLASECPLLESLDLSFNGSLKNFEENVKYFKIFSSLTQRSAVFFQSLKHLNLMSCENLQSVSVQADLETICLQDCKKLTAFRVECISFNHYLSYADFRGVSSFPEKDFNKFLAGNTQEIKIDDRTCKGAFANVLKEFPTYPSIPENPSRKNALVRIPAKLLDFVFMVLERPENRHLCEFFSVKDMTDAELAKICIEINKNLPSKNITIKYVDISNNKGIVFTPNVSMMKTVTSGGLPNVEILDLSQMNFSNTMFPFKLFGEWLKANKVLKKLIMNEVSIKNEDLGIILDGVNKKNSLIESLCLRKNGFRFLAFQSLAIFLENNSNLKYLDLSYNILEERSIKMFFKALTHNKTLLGLTLKALNPKKIENNNIIPDYQDYLIHDESMDDIRDSLNNNRVLQEIDLRNHPISQQKAEALAKILQMSNNLSVIKLKSPLVPDIQILNKFQKPIMKEEAEILQSTKCKILRSSLLNQSNFGSQHRTTSNYLEKSQRNVLPDTWVFGLGIDGGGMRGVIPAILIECLSKHTKYQVHQMFDYIGGSSIGGIIALACAGTLDGVNPVCLAENLPDMFLTYGKDIFGRIKNKMDPLGIMANKYNESGLESVIKKYFKNSFLSETLTNVLVTSVKKNNNEMVIFDSRKAFLDPECDFFMRNVARATSAAPTFFPSAEFYNLVGSEFFSLLDGGVGKNDPTYFVFEEVKAIAENYGIPQKFSVISFGTGAFADPKVISQNAGVMEVKNLMNKILDTPAELDQAIFKEKYGNVKYRRFQAMLKFAKNQDISLDNIDAEVVKVYRDAAYSLAEEFLIENYGEFQNVSLVDWLAENAARKKELI